VQGSWWNCWEAWLREHGTTEVPARVVPDVRFEGRVVPAPGTHVFQE
jgi:poly(3-hydroxyalkanoate) synthetase